GAPRASTAGRCGGSARASPASARTSSRVPATAAAAALARVSALRRDRVNEASQDVVGGYRAEAESGEDRVVRYRDPTGGHRLGEAVGVLQREAEAEPVLGDVEQRRILLKKLADPRAVGVGPERDELVMGKDVRLRIHGEH